MVIWQSLYLEMASSSGSLPFPGTPSIEVLRVGGKSFPHVANSGPNNTGLKEGVLAYQKLMGESLAEHQIACAKTVQENHTQARMKSGCNEGLFPKNQ